MSWHIVWEGEGHFLRQHLIVLVLDAINMFCREIRVLHIVYFSFLYVIIQCNCLRFLDQFWNLCLFTAVDLNGLGQLLLHEYYVIIKIRQNVNIKEFVINSTINEFIYFQPSVGVWPALTVIDSIWDYLVTISAVFFQFMGRVSNFQFIYSSFRHYSQKKFAI